MDDSEFKETAKRLRAVNSVIKDLDPSMRDDAWGLLRGFVSPTNGSTEPPSSPAKKGRETKKTTERARSKKPTGDAPPPPDASDDVLLERFESEKDADNLSLVLAIFYKRHGRGPVATTYLKALAESLNIEIPNRPDMTLKRRKSQVRKQGDGWKIIPGGETWLKETYGVKRGKDPLPSDS